MTEMCKNSFRWSYVIKIKSWFNSLILPKFKTSNNDDNLHFFLLNNRQYTLSHIIVIFHMFLYVNV